MATAVPRCTRLAGRLVEEERATGEIQSKRLDFIEASVARPRVDFILGCGDWGHNRVRGRLGRERKWNQVDVEEEGRDDYNPTARAPCP